ncbi:MAG: LLM class flavin-dependent oxidoreductase [Actinomycetia bacterium]|nr:LLM class flavin-dependent oxidoreductase [Actinomycetes bacterium]
MTPLRCALIGADTLLIECGQILRERGHDIVSVAAGSARVAAWAIHAGVSVHEIEQLDEWAEDLRRHSVDYLFAITHLELLPASVVAAANRMAINFHDGPLPEYAGLNTPAWGILRGEREWGVTWHRIDEGVDTGDVIAQRRFAIAERETSLSLNTRNFEEAIDSFNDLLNMLEAGQVTALPQGANAPRAVFRRADRPDGVLDFSQTAVEVDRVVRALHFGPHPNPVAASVVWHPLAAIVVGSSDIVDIDSPSAPGTLLAVGVGTLTVACSTGAVVLGDLHGLDGTPCSATQFLAVTGAKAGDVLPPLGIDQRQWLTSCAHASQPDEATLVARLGEIAPAMFPWPHDAQQVRGSARAVANVPLTLACEPARVVSALAVLLTRLSPEGGSDVVLAGPPVPDFAQSLMSSETVFSLATQTLDGTRTSSWFRDLVARAPSLAARPELASGLDLPIGIRVSRNDTPLPQPVVVLQPSDADNGWELEYDAGRVNEADVNEFARCLALTIAAFDSHDRSPADVPLLSAETYERVVHEWNATDAVYESACIHDLIARQIAATPQRQAIVCGAASLTYAELGQRSNRLAAHLQQLGVGPGSLVGVYVERSIDLVVAVLAVLQAGGAYVPLDPAYPTDRVRHMIADSGARVIVCPDKDRAKLPLPIDAVDRTIVAVDAPRADGALPTHQAKPDDIAYCIYTSGSSGTPKGVLVEHRNVANLFAAMDHIIKRTDSDTWCAVTSLSFDISILELLYTLARGMRIALYVPDTYQLVAARRPMDFSLFYFSADEAHATDGGKYQLLLDGARFADANGFCAVWTPERHFHAFGGLYPNPAVTAAAIATITKRVSIRAGSVVLPLHHPVEIAEAWSMIDNLSNGRAGVAFASGWQPNDFVLRPQNFAHAKEAMFEGIEQIRRLWRGESVSFEGPNGKPVAVATLPRPVQAELPTWITTAGDPASFAAAGTAGANLLTHLVGQSIDQLASKIGAYRTARAAAGYDPTTGVVTLMLHTFVGDDDATVRATVREPLRRYLNTSYNVLREHAWSFPTFRRHDGAPVTNPDDLVDDDMANLAGDDLDAVLDFAAERYYENSGLFGTPDQVLPRVAKLHQIGVDEIACLVDFGVAPDTVLRNLPHLARVREVVAKQSTTNPDDASDASLAELIATSSTTHMQCTPSMARMLTHDPAMRTALGGVQQLLVGGEALPTDLAHELQSLVGGAVTNMYGPTETTVWSSSWPLQSDCDWTPIGNPIANTQIYVLDHVGQPTPPGVAGHLWIGGDGVARGYHQRAELTAERFRPNPFREHGRMYRTGDLARWRAGPDGCATLEFIGRADEQVKLRGHRIELGEIESAICRIADVEDCAVIVLDRSDDRADQQLVAYVATGMARTFDTTAMREQLRTRLPEVMVPNQVVVLSALPRTPNGKLDRRALPAQAAEAAIDVAQPTTDVEGQVLADWHDVLATNAIGIDDNFFDAGGHSLLVVRLHRQLQQTLGRTIPLTDLYRFPTVRTFAASLASNAPSPAIGTALDRAARRRASTQGRP